MPSPNDNWRDMIQKWRDENAINDDQEVVLTHFYNEREWLLKQDMEDISAQYDRYFADDGKVFADAWLKETAMAMGRRDREDTDRFLSSLGVA